MELQPKTGHLPILGSQDVLEPVVKQGISSGFGISRDSVLERLSVILAPLLLAAASKKKKSLKKRVKRKPKKPVKRAKAKRVPKRKSKKPPHRKPFKPPVNLKLSRKNQLKAKAVPPPPKVVEEEEPPLPPVAPIGRAILLVPRDGSYVESPHPTLRWLSVGGSTKYELHWGEDQSLATKYMTVSLATEATIPVEKPLRVGAIYYWRVRGGNEAGWGPWSLTASFRVLEETP